MNKEVMSNKVSEYISTRYYHPYYISGYYPIYELFKHKSYEEIARFFEILEREDEKREEYLEYKSYRIENFKLGIKKSLFSVGKSEQQIDDLASQIYENEIRMTRNLPIYLFLLNRQEELGKRFKIRREDLLNKVLRKSSGALLYSHHWGAFQYQILMLISKNLPVTFIVSDSSFLWFEELIDFEKLNNVKILGLHTGTIDNSKPSEQVVYEAVRDLKKGRLVFIGADHAVSEVKPKDSTVFLGNEVFLPVAPIAMAIKAQVPIIYLYSHYSLHENLITFSFDNIVYTEGMTSSDVYDLSVESMSYMENILRKFPDQWVYADWYYKFMLKK